MQNLFNVLNNCATYGQNVVGTKLVFIFKEKVLFQTVFTLINIEEVTCELSSGCAQKRVGFHIKCLLL